MVWLDAPNALEKRLNDLEVQLQTLEQQVAASDRRCWRNIWPAKQSMRPRADVDPAVLTPALRKALDLAQTTNELVPTLWTLLPFELGSIIDIGYDQFLEEPHDAEKFIRKLEEARQLGVKKGLWPSDGK